jgi:hypothetical protein
MQAPILSRDASQLLSRRIPSLLLRFSRLTPSGAERTSNRKVWFKRPNFNDSARR